jgi:effector-binding domain-containing protein
LNFGEKGLATAPFRFVEENNQTTVLWGFETDLGDNPLYRWMGLMFESMIGHDLEEGLENLKVVSETILQERQPLVRLQTLHDMNYISLREEVEFNQISTAMARMYGVLYTAIQHRNIEMNDMPFAIYHKIDGEIVDLECGIPVTQLIEGTDLIQQATLQSRTYIEADHIGAYDSLGETHQFMQDWLEAHNIQMAGAPMEKYLTDPFLVKDTSQWITAVFYPIVVN